MLEICVHRLVNEVDPFDLSASIAERGKNAGPETWSNSVACATEKPLLKDEDERRRARDYFRGFGAWEDEEIDAWTAEEVDAMVLQYAAGDLREAQSCCPGDGMAGIDWRAYEREAERGRINSNLFRHKRKLWISLSE